MKKNLSVFNLYMRMGFYRLLGVITLTCAIQLIFFFIEAKAALSGEMPLCSELFEESRFALISGGGFLVFSSLICLGGMDMKAKSSYTLKRLRISEERILFWQALCCAGFYLLFYFAQASSVLLSFRIYSRVFGISFQGIYNQAAYLALWQNSFLHGLIPLGDWLIYLRNIVMIIYLSDSAAIFAYGQRRGKGTFGFAVALTLVLSTFRCPIESNMPVIIMIITCFLMMAVGRLIWWGKKNEEIS